MTMRSAALLLPALVVLAACDRSAPDQVPTKPQRVLAGSVSDAMLETDQLQVEAPLAAPVASEVPGLAGSDKASAALTSSTSEAAAADETAAAPSPGAPAPAPTAAVSPQPLSPQAVSTPRPTSSPRPGPSP